MPIASSHGVYDPEFGWKVDLNTFQLEVFVLVSDDLVMIAFPLHYQRLSAREHIHGLGLKASIAYAMCRLVFTQSRSAFP